MESFYKRWANQGAPVDISDDTYISKKSQLMETMSKHFSDYEDLVLAACKTEKFSPDLKWEPSRRGQDFPHLYRELLLGHKRHTNIKKTVIIRCLGY